MRNRKKWKLSPEALNLVAERFGILAEPARLRILQSLETGELSVTQIAQAVKATQPNVSKHLKVLLGAGLLERRQEGNAAIYCIKDESVFALCDTVCESLEARFEAQKTVLRS